MDQPLSLDAASQAMRQAMRLTVKRHSIWYLIQGALMILAGLVAIIYPLFSVAAIGIFLGWLLIIAGVIQAFSLIGAHRVPHFWVQLLSAVLAAVVGFVFVSNPDIGIATLGLLLIVYLLVQGVSRIIFSLTIRPLPNWGWILASGIIGIFLAAYLWSSPATAIWLLGLLIGVQLVCEGAALAYLAWTVRKAE